MRNISFVLGSLALGTLIGCVKSANTSSSADSAETAVDSQDTVEAEGNMMAAVSDGADQAGVAAVAAPAAPTADQVAAYIASHAPARFLPAGCATATASGANVVLQLSDCTGPRGLLHVTGELDLAVSIPAAGGIQINGMSNGTLEVNQASLTVNSQALYQASGTGRTLTVSTQGSGTGPLGNDVVHDGNYTVSWDSTTQCHTLDGSWSTEITTSTASATRSNDVMLSRCAGGCPTGSVVHHGFGGLTLTITFNGTNVASWSTSTGKSGTVNLQCQ